MTNNQIIYNAAILAGIVTVEDVERGELPELHTFAEWKRAGYIVRRGEHAVIKCAIWMPKTGRGKAQKAEYIPVDADADAPQESSFYKKVAFFFTAAQVAPIKA